MTNGIEKNHPLVLYGTIGTRPPYKLGTIQEIHTEKHTIGIKFVIIFVCTSFIQLSSYLSESGHMEDEIYLQREDLLV